MEAGVDRIIDSNDNEFVLSNPKLAYNTLMLDPLLIQDLTFMLIAASLLGMLFESCKQPVINGYLVAGALVGPNGFGLIKELVQVRGQLKFLNILLDSTFEQKWQPMHCSLSAHSEMGIRSAVDRLHIIYL